MPQTCSKSATLEQLGIRETDIFKSEHAPTSVSSDTRPEVSLCQDYVTSTSTCAVEDTRSVHSNSDGSPDKSPRTNILSRMAKTKASWVENQKVPEYLTQRRSPILCKGSPLGSSLLTPFMESNLSTDKATKGFRDGKKFDLLPISKYLAQYRDERKIHKEKRLPLVRISSYHTYCGCMDSLEFWDCAEGQPNSAKQMATFFTTKDVFKPYHARLLPTRGEALFVEPSQDKLNAYITTREIKLPRLHRTGGNETFFTETSGRLKTRNGGLDSKRNVYFPVIVS